MGLIRRASILGPFDNGSHIEWRDLCERAAAPSRNELAANVQLDALAVSLARQFAFDEVLGDGGERIRPLALLGKPLAFNLFPGIDAPSN